MIFHDNYRKNWISTFIAVPFSHLNPKKPYMVKLWSLKGIFFVLILPLNSRKQITLLRFCILPCKTLDNYRKFFRWLQKWYIFTPDFWNPPLRAYMKLKIEIPAIKKVSMKLIHQHFSFVQPVGMIRRTLSHYHSFLLSGLCFVLSLYFVPPN